MKWENINKPYNSIKKYYKKISKSILYMQAQHIHILDLVNTNLLIIKHKITKNKQSKHSNHKISASNSLNFQYLLYILLKDFKKYINK